jgi:hypothetical protein
MGTITEYPTPEQGVEVSPRELSLLMAEDPVVIEIILDEEFGVFFEDVHNCGTPCKVCGACCHHTCRCMQYEDEFFYGNPPVEVLLKQQQEDAAFEESTCKRGKTRRAA